MKKLVTVLACIAAAVVLILVGIRLIDGRSAMAIFVRQVMGMTALNTERYEADKADTWDILYTDAVKTYEKMYDAGVDVCLHTAAKMPHVYPILPCPEGKAARKEIAGILRAI